MAADGLADLFCVTHHNLMGVMTLSEVGMDIKHRQPSVDQACGGRYQAGLIAHWQAIVQVHLRQELHALHHQPESHIHTFHLALHHASNDWCMSAAARRLIMMWREKQQLPLLLANTCDLSAALYVLYAMSWATQKPGIQAFQ